MLAGPAYQTPGQNGMGVSRGTGPSGAAQQPGAYANNYQRSGVQTQGLAQQATSPAGGYMPGAAPPQGNPFRTGIGPAAAPNSLYPNYQGVNPSILPGGNTTILGGETTTFGSGSHAINTGGQVTNTGAPAAGGAAAATRANMAARLFPGMDPNNLDQFSNQILDSVLSLPNAGQQSHFADNFNAQSYQTALPIVSGQYAMDTALNDLQTQGLQQQAGYGVTGLMNGNMQAMQDYQNSLQGLDLQRQALSQQNQGLNQDLGYYKQLQGLAGQTYKNQLAGYDLADTGYNRDFGTGMRNLRADATQRGAYLSQGFIDDKADTAGKLSQQLQGSQLGRQGAGITRDQAMASAQHAMQGVHQQLAQNGITAQQFGLDEHKFQQALQRGMQQAGINAQQGAQAIQNQLANNEITGGSNTLQFIQSLLEAAGVYDNQG